MLDMLGPPGPDWYELGGLANRVNLEDVRALYASQEVGGAICPPDTRVSRGHIYFRKLDVDRKLQESRSGVRT